MTGYYTYMDNKGGYNNAGKVSRSDFQAKQPAMKQEQ